MTSRTRGSIVVLGAVLALLLTALGAVLAPTAAEERSAGGTIAVRVYNCPAGMRPETMVGDFCGNLVTRGFRLTLTTPTGRTLTLADARRQGGIVTWSGLAFGTYRLAETKLPAGHDTYVVGGPTPGPGRLTLGRSSPSIDTAIYNFKPDPGVEGASLTIHNRICPNGYTGTNHYRDCHGNPAPAGLEFTAEGAERVTGAIDAAGNVTFDLEPGTYTVRGGVPGEFATLNVFCAPAAAPGTPFPFTLLRGGTRGPHDPTGIRIALGSGAEVNCDWYNTPQSQRG